MGLQEWFDQPHPCLARHKAAALSCTTAHPLPQPHSRGVPGHREIPQPPVICIPCPRGAGLARRGQGRPYLGGFLHRLSLAVVAGGAGGAGRVAAAGANVLGDGGGAAIGAGGLLLPATA